MQVMFSCLARLSPVAFLSLVLVFSCSDSSDHGSSGDAGTVVLEFVHRVDSQPLVADEILYINAAGNQYSVTKFEYLMTNLELQGASGSVELADVVYGNAIEPGYDRYTFENVPAGDYDGLHFEWGVPPAENTEGSLAPEYDGMIWPTQFGGGYHAMRFEGDWTDVSPGDSSYKLHAGHLRRCADMMIPFEDCPEEERLDETGMASVDLPEAFAFSLNQGATVTLQVLIELNNWMNEPVYDLGALWSDQFICPPNVPAPCTLGFPTMPGPEPQQMMRENADDVFSADAFSGPSPEAQGRMPVNSEDVFSVEAVSGR